MPFPKLDNDLLNIGSTNGKIPLIGAGDKLLTSLLDTGAGSNKLVQLDGDGKLPAIDASLLTNLPAPSGGVGAWNLIDTQIANNVAQVDFTTGIDGSYKEYVIRGTNIIVSTSAHLGLRVRVAGTFRTGGEYTYGGDGTSNQQGILSFSDASGNFYKIIPSSVMAYDAGGNVSFDLSITNPAGTTATKALRSNAGGAGNGYNSGFACQSGGRWFGASTSQPFNYSALDGFRILPDAGTLVTGTFKLYGLL